MLDPFGAELALIRWLLAWPSFTEFKRGSYSDDFAGPTQMRRAEDVLQSQSFSLEGQTSLSSVRNVSKLPPLVVRRI